MLSHNVGITFVNTVLQSLAVKVVCEQFGEKTHFIDLNNLKAILSNERNDDEGGGGVMLSHYVGIAFVNTF